MLVLDHAPELVIPQQQHQPGPAHAADGRSCLFADPCARRLQVGEEVGQSRIRRPAKPVLIQRSWAERLTCSWMFWAIDIWSRWRQGLETHLLHPD